jgi:hypothetical protein
VLAPCSEKARITYLRPGPVKTGFYAIFMARYFRQLGRDMQGWDARPNARQVVGRAFNSSWQIVRTMPWLLPVTVIAFAIVSIAIARISNLLPVNMSDESDWIETSRIRGLTYIDLVPLQLLELLGMLLKALVEAVPGVLVSRYILLGETTLSPLSKLTPIIWRFALWTFALDAWSHFWAQTNYLTDSLWGVALMLAAPFSAYFPLALVFPGIAVGAEYNDVLDRASSGLRHIRGTFWLFLRAISPVLVVVIITTAILYLDDFQLYTNPIAEGKRQTSWTFLSWEAVIIATTDLVGAAISAWVYSWATISRMDQKI